jgi:hypothetical protein
MSRLTLNTAYDLPQDPVGLLSCRPALTGYSVAPCISL